MNARTEWLEARKNYIGGSDLPAIIGLDEYKTPVDVWLEKTGRSEPEEAGEPAFWGTTLEDVIARVAADRNGWKIQRVNQPFQHPEYAFLRGNVDRRILNVSEVMECKNLNAFTGASLKEPLDKHVVQVQTYLGLTGWERGHLIYLVGGNRLVQFEIARDQELIDLLTAQAVTFWQYVERDEMPPIDPEHAATPDLLAKLYPGTNGETVELPPDLEPWAGVLAQAKADIKSLDAVVTAAENRIKAAMRDAAVGVLPDGTQFTRKLIKRAGYTVEPTEYMTFSTKKAKA